MSTVTAPDVWTMSVPAPGNGDFKPCPAGNFAARICGLFDVGHHPEEKTDDKTKVKTVVDTHKLVLVFELSKKQDNGQPFTIAHKLTMSMHEKSNLFDLVKNATGAQFTAGQAFSPLTLLGLPVSVNVVHKPGKEAGKVHANVGSVTQWMEGMPEPAWQITPVAWSIRQGVAFPPLGWLPMVYGQTIDAFASVSCEARGIAPGKSPAHAAPAAPTPTPPTQSTRMVGTANTGYPPACRNLMGRYGLQEGYGAEDLAEVSGRLTGGLPADDRDVLETHAIPY